MSRQRLPASPDRLDAEVRSLRFMHDKLATTVTDELKTIRKAVDENQLIAKQSSVSVES